MVTGDLYYSASIAWDYHTSLAHVWQCPLSPSCTSYLTIGWGNTSPFNFVSRELPPQSSSFASVVGLWDGVQAWGNLPDPTVLNAYNMFFYDHRYYTPPTPGPVFPCVYQYCTPHKWRYPSTPRGGWYRHWGLSGYVESPPHNMYYVLGSDDCRHCSVDGRPWPPSQGIDDEPGAYRWDTCLGPVAGSPCCSTLTVRISDQVPPMNYIYASCTMTFLGEPSCKRLRWRIVQGQARVASPPVWDGSSYQLQLTDRHDRQQDPALGPAQ